MCLACSIIAKGEVWKQLSEWHRLGISYGFVINVCGDFGACAGLLINMPQINTMYRSVAYVHHIIFCRYGLPGLGVSLGRFPFEDLDIHPL